ncbi:DUF3656 domain-containing U32 family peptidase [Thermincola ferriacetica]
MFKPELLAPAGSWDALVAAVQNGADAVYVGGRMFNARQYASNFDREELIRAVDYAHVRGVRVYVTVNTLIADNEISELVAYLKFLYETGVDAVIVQDLGMLRLARSVFPELNVHASTQMTLHNTPGVELVKASGVKRVVLAREMSLDEIKQAKQRTGVEVEVFVHGALCISYSGQCLMSSLIGGRSGNRGRCAQPCRLHYTLVDERGKILLEPEEVGKYLLSPRDLRLLHHIPELAEAGIDALKIEGRMKRPEYVATVTRIYRQALDRYAMAPYNFEITPEEDRQLLQIFNRDFTTGYFMGPPGADLMSYKRPNNRGIRLGRVVNYNRKKATMSIQLDERLNLGDGIEVWVSEGGRQGTVVDQILLAGNPVESGLPGQTVTVPVKGKVKPGDRVFKTHDALLMRQAQQSFTSPKELRKVNIAMKVRVKAGEPLRIIVEDTEGNKAVARTEFIAEEAINRPLTKETIRRQVQRLGNTPFNLATLEIKIDGNIMVPLSEINEARRKALHLLEQQRIMLKRPVAIPETLVAARLEEADSYRKDKEKREQRKIMRLSAAVGNKEAALAAFEAGVDVVYVGADGLNGTPVLKVDDLQELAAKAESQGAQLVFALPRITKDKDLVVIAPFLQQAGKLNLGILATNLGTLKTVRDVGFSNIYADYSLNAFNSQALLWLQDNGVSQVTLSPELTLEQIERLAAEFNVEVVGHGALPLMISEHCVVGSVYGGFKEAQKCNQPCRGGEQFALKDRLGMLFPLVTDCFCRSHIFNPKELCLIEDLKPLYEAGVCTVRLELRKDSPDYVKKVAGFYRQEIDKLMKNKNTYAPDPDAKETLVAMTAQGVTKGHLYRGVL